MTVKPYWIELSFDAYDPEEPRKGAGEAGGGEWTSGGGGAAAAGAKGAKAKAAKAAQAKAEAEAAPEGRPHNVAFVSPNIGHIDLARAEKGLNSTRQRELVKAGDEIDKGLGLVGKTTPCVGAWADGAENSLMAEFKDCSLATLKVSAAMRGWLADQKSVLIFRSNPTGGQRLYHFTATGELEDIHAHLLQDGLPFHTLVPTKKGATVYVYGDAKDGDTALAVTFGAGRYGSEVTTETGDGEFVGTRKEDGTDREQRDDARGVYTRVIEETGNKGYHDLWARIHSAHGPSLLKPLAGSVGHPDMISSRNVTSTGVGATQKEERATAAKNYRRIDIDSMKTDPAGFEHNVGLFSNAGLYPMFREDELQGSAEHRAGVIKQRMEDNIRFVYNQVPPEDQKSWARWYNGANAIVKDDAGHYGLPEASVAGVYAALSPGQLWDINVWMGKKVIDTYLTKQDAPWTPAMTEAAAEIFKTPRTAAYLPLIEGKALKELSDPVQKAAWVRTYVEANDKDRSYQRVTPEGGFGEKITTKAGAPAKAGWQSFSAIANAIECLDSNGDRELISDALGGAHKVRSFYNNMLAPDSPNGDVTIDTHAMGAAFLSPWGQKAEQVSQGFGTSPQPIDQSEHWEPAKNSSVTGVAGTYGLYADAYRDVAKEVGVEPRELQSIVWEAKREMFADNSPTKARQIDAAWQTYRNHQADLPTTQKAIAAIAMKAKEPYPPRKAAKK